MLFCKLMALCVCLITIHLHLASSSILVNRDLELLDEVHDAQIYEAVLKSVKEWERKAKLKKLHNRIKRDDVGSVCYPEVGCFDSSGPFDYLDMLPSTPEEIGTKFLMYPGRSRGRTGTPPAEIPFHNISDAFVWAKQGFNNSLPTKVLIHGFGSGCTHIWVYEMRSALMAVEEINVICVDWESGAILPNYVKATANTRLVGKQLAILLQGLVKHNGLSLRNTHLIGFSLGAHVAGFTGAEIGNLSRITGLDPAGPLFESQDPRVRLDQSDAEFVDVIHSNGENIILGGLGSYQPMGHVDFYPNGGRMQKGCSNLFVGAVSDIIWSSAIEGRSLCNHRRAYKFFTDSVSPRCHFPAFPCDSYEDFLSGKCFPCTDKRKCGNMGYYADRSKGRGQLYLITRDEEPFCAHQYHVKLETSTSPINLISYGKIQITLIGDSLLNETFVLTRKEDEEMILGRSISKILVPHPILAEPTAIQVLYTAYSGWLSSGLTQWRMDKVTLSDSFGKISSVCKKNLVLDSGIPVTLPLYPGECNLPKQVHHVEDNIKDFATVNDSHVSDSSNLIPLSEKAGHENVTKEFLSDKYSSMFKDAIDFLHIPWSRERENNLIDNELKESGRALNTRVVNLERKYQTDDIIKEIVEPILKPQSIKNGRSHNPEKQRPEITEPVLRATALRSRTTKSDSIFKNDLISKLANDRKEIQYSFYDIEEEKSLTAPHKMVDKYQKKKRQESNVENLGSNDPDNPIEAIVTTVQFLPRRLARMFEQAEKYARETILPLVSTYTPKFLSDIIVPKLKPQFFPLFYNEEVPNATSSNKISVTDFRNGSNGSKRFDPPPDITAADVRNNETKLTTPFTHIQKIHKKGQKYEFVFPDIAFTTVNKTVMESSRNARYESTNVPSSATMQKESTGSSHDSKKRSLQSPIGENQQTNGIYIELPIFDPSKKMKYIPLSSESSNRND